MTSLGIVAAAVTLVVQPSSPARIQILTETQSIQPGRPTWIAVRMDLDDDWHTYWQNPGETGQAPRFTWKLPENTKVEGPFFPAPVRYVDSDLTSFALFGSPVFLWRMNFPPTLRASTVRLEVNARFLVCKESCIPGAGQASATLPITPRTALPTGHARALQTAFSAIRRPVAGQVRLTKLGSNLVVRVPESVLGSASATMEFDFFSAKPEVLTFARPTSRWNGKTAEITLPLVGAAPTRLTGLLTARAGQRSVDVWVDEPLRP